jgi:hypothetical protein
MEENMQTQWGYPAQARVTIYDFNKLAMEVYWYDTYREAVKFTKSLGADKNIIVGGIDIVEVKA